MKHRAGLAALAAALLALATACGGSDASELHHTPLNELSDEELDQLCEDVAERTASDDGVQRFFCLFEANFNDEASCTAAYDLCVHGPIPNSRAACSHFPAEAIQCDKSYAELGCDNAPRLSVEEAIGMTNCATIGNSSFNLANELARLRPRTCPLPPRGCVAVVNVRLFDFNRP